MERKTIGKYIIEKKLGQGGMGVVYKAYDPILDRVVAIKLMTSELSKDERLIKRFIREARISAKLDHPNIIKVYDLGQEGPNYYLVMEYIDGQTLRDYLRNRKSINLLESLKIFKQILEAMAYAHSRGVVHRDLKPENIMLTRNLSVKVMDFGLAFIKGSHSITSPGSVMGTLAYFSPEQAQGLEVDHRTDIYALGVILFELVTGQLPIIASNPAAMIHKLLTQPPPLPSTLNPSIPEKLDEIILKALAKNPEDRYSSTNLFLAEIDAVILKLSPVMKVKPDIQATSDLLASLHGSVNTTEDSKPKLDDTPPTIPIKPRPTSSTNRTNQIIKSALSRDLPPNQPANLSDKIALRKLKELRSIISDSILAQGEEVAEGVRCKLCGAISPPNSKFCKNCGAPLTLERPLEVSPDILERAKALYSEGRYEEVIDILSPYVRTSTDKKLIYLFTRSLMKLGRYEEAINYLEPKLGIVKSTRLLELAGDILYHLGDYERASEYYEKFFLKTNSPEGLYKLAKSTMRFNKQRAMKLFEKLLELDPSYTRAKRYLAELSIEIGDLPRAVTLLQDYIRDVPDDSKAYLALGKLYMELGQMSEVYKLYMDVLGMRLEDPDLLYQIARYYLEIDKKKEALELLKRVMKLDPNNKEAIKEGYLLARSLGDDEALSEFLEKLVELDPEASNFHYELGEVYMRLREYDKAIREFRRALELSPGDLEIAMKLGDALIKAGRYAEARELFSQLYAIDPTDPKILEKLSIISHLMGDTDLAIKYLEEAVALDPTNLDYVKGLAKMLRDAGRLNDAANYLKAVVEEQPNDPVANALLGEIYFRQKLYGSASYYLRQAITLDPKLSWVYDLLIKVHLAKGDYSSALDDINLILGYLETQGDSEELYKWYYRKCQVLVELDRDKEALELANLILPRAKGLYKYALKAFITFHQGNPFEAIDILKSALDRYMSKELLELIADYRIRIGEYFKAWKYAEKLLEMEPNNPRYYFMRGLINYYLSSYGHAVKDLEKAKELGETREDLYLMLSHAYLNLGRYKDVINLLENQTVKRPEYNFFLYKAYEGLGNSQKGAIHLQLLIKDYPELAKAL